MKFNFIYSSVDVILSCFGLQPSYRMHALRVISEHIIFR